ncbi:hypothetical protein [Celeribacter neptunius]|uniref:hypothetical protein n=1 Tax=Celeribacter neptunius TaxID=588602 RepID=UPI001160904C|nr:hypothetical protein [Celeribacter neptunius]
MPGGPCGPARATRLDLRFGRHGEQGVVLTLLEGRELALRGWWRDLTLNLRPEDDPGLSGQAPHAPGSFARSPSGAA